MVDVGNVGSVGDVYVGVGVNVGGVGGVWMWWM